MGKPFRHAAAILIASAAALSGCSTQVALSVLGGGTSALVTHNLNGSVSRTFTHPRDEVREAVLAALDNMGLSAEAAALGATEGDIVATAGDRSIEVGFESLGERLTVIRVVARRPGFLRDNATAGEVVSQAERALAALRGEAVAAAPARRKGSGVLRSSLDAGIYILHLDTIPADGMRTMKPLPSSLQSHVLYTSLQQRGGRKHLAVNLGYFSSEEEANAARRLAVALFPGATVVRFRQEAPLEEEASPEERLHKASRVPVLHRAAYF